MKRKTLSQTDFVDSIIVQLSKLGVYFLSGAGTVIRNNSVKVLVRL